MIMKVKYSNVDPNSWLPEEVAKEFEVVNWRGGWLQFFPSYSHLGAPYGRVNLKDITLPYAERLFNAGFPHLRRKKKAEKKNE